MAYERTTRSHLWLIGIVLAITAIIFSAIVVKAQNQKTQDILTRLVHRNIPVKTVTTVSHLPYTIEILLQSSSIDDNLSIADNWFMLLAQREAMLAYRIGSRLNSYRLVVINQQGKPISTSEIFLYPEDRSQQLPEGHPTQTNSEVKETVSHELDLNGLYLQLVDVFNEEAIGSTGQVLLVEVTAQDVNMANQALPIFLKSYFRLLETINPEFGSNIVLTHLRITDNKNQVLLDYVKDLEGGTSHWTIAEGVYDDWFPKPVLAPEAPDATLRIETNFLYPPPPTSTAVPYP